MERYKYFILLSFIILFQFSAITQKVERETGVSRSEVPENSLEFIKNKGLKNKVKWYKETTSGRDSYEAKFKFNDRFYSIEFDTLGTIEDIEILIKPKNLSKDKKNILRNSILKEFQKFKWMKIQEQYTGEEKDLEKVFQNKSSDGDLNYEVEIEAKFKGGNWKMYELLISPEGRIIKKREITLRPTDNLNY